MEGYNKGVKGSGEACSKLLYQRRDIIRGGEILYWRRDMEEAIWSSYNWGGMWRELFGALINKEGYGGSCSEL